MSRFVFRQNATKFFGGRVSPTDFGSTGQFAKQIASQPITYQNTAARFSAHSRILVDESGLAPESYRLRLSFLHT